MDAVHLIDWSREALRMALMLSGPLLAAALIAGLVVNILQTLTQLHEPVVSLVPRLVAVLMVMLASLPWLLHQWIGFTAALIQSIPELL